MENNLKDISELRSHTYSVQIFAKKVIITLIALAVVSSTAVILLIYLPLKTELEKSLVDNFSQLSYIRFASLQNNMDRGLEGARSLSSRTVIRDAILDYNKGKINLGDLIKETQLKYEDGARALEYLLNAERSVDDNVIARYAAKGYGDQDCIIWNSLTGENEPSSALCLTGGHEYFIVCSPILSQGRIVGYDRLIFDLSGQIHTLCTETLKSELMCHENFEALVAGSDMLQYNEAYSLFYKSGIYYQAFHIQNNTHFVSQQNGESLLEPVYRLSRQVLLAGIGVLLIFTLAVYLFVIRHAKDKLESGCSSLKNAMSEANTDPLTKVGSRRLGEEFLAYLFECFQKGEASPAVILFDIDSLKKINDTHGHTVGDMVIRSVAEAVQKNISDGDMLMRWGGDEFIGIFNGLSQEKAVPFAQNLLKIVSELKIGTGRENIKPSISMGISYFKGGDISFIDVVNRADQAMYKSKAGGRERVSEL